MINAKRHRKTNGKQMAVCVVVNQFKYRKLPQCVIELDYFDIKFYQIEKSLMVIILFPINTLI